MAVPLLLPMMLMLSAMAATFIVFSRAVGSIEIYITAPDGNGGFPACKSAW
jgi:hypothetical protein